MLQPVIENTLLVELNLPTLAVGQRYTFADQPQLRGGTVLINGVETYTADQLSTSLNQATVIPAGTAANFTIVLAVNETEDVQNLPYFTCVSAFNGGFIRMFNNKMFNLVKSFVICNNITGLTAGQSLMFNFYYKDAKSPR